MYIALSPFVEEQVAYAKYLLGHFSMKLAYDSALTSGIDFSKLLLAISYLGMIILLSAIIFYWTSFME